MVKLLDSGSFRKVVLAVVLLASVLSLAIAVVDDAGRIVNIPMPPRRVVSAAPSATRYLQALGLENRIIGVTAWDSYQKAENIGNMVPLNIEKIYSLRPDLVIMFGGFQFPEVEKLEKAKLTAYVLNANTLTDIIKAVGQLGAIFNVKEKADKLVNQLRQKMTEMGQKTSKIPLEKRPTVFFTITVPDDKVKELWTAGTGSYMNELIVIAGGRNIAAPYSGNNGWLSVSWEWLVKEDPDIIIIGAYGDPKQVEQAVKNHSIMKSLKAVKTGKVFIVDGSEVSQAAPHLFDYLEVFYNFFYGGK
ncbi:iron complex transport system substrate-binding protein [Fervidobacterium changbaicum]|uniref:ABC transporter substrate-binding protein n=2 Tax=Fervidobacterium TaxID=2422 RepID=A0AAI8CJD4_FERIS|nr:MULTISPECIES: ABC transporter substrate-binding protein [Fervidobacterium]AMW32505.1 ABC transporter substrate-binding protein [Fervidobacterium islandicum]QAV32652.1 ABC transporter substrate-binding protein [Fervidobacterium changbaicum]SDH42819.1 iron complex transport system substrate-binding protein [Fervidobacterium changbaicum]